jgi:ribosomal protein L11 methyltransferase
MHYKAVSFSLKPTGNEIIEILYALLDGNGFEGILEEGPNTVAYVKSENFSLAALTELKSHFAKSGYRLEYSVKDIDNQNWNLLWEKNFEPVIIKDLCAVRAPFHPEFRDYKYQITIEPKMSFGTGHHFTTRLMIEQVLESNLSGKKVLDMGCGTGILSILASMCGAESITAIDIDSWAYENSVENITRNKVQNISVLMGGKDVIPVQKFDLVLSNINRNILADQFPEYARVMDSGSLIIVSGFLAEDIPFITEVASNTGYLKVLSRSLQEWALIMFEKI